ncbi:MAG: hypothetical protein WD830_11335 [Chloroflexota bacterium]
MLPDTDDAAVQADAYIDALLTGHRRSPAAVLADSATEGPLGHQAGVRDAIRLLEKSLPRFHPSFLFEEWLAEQLRRHAGRASEHEHSSGKIIPIAVMRRPTASGSRLPDKRLLVGSAIASGVSIAGAAMFAWRRSRN